MAQCYEPSSPIAIYILNGWVDNGNKSFGCKILNKDLLKSLKIKRCDAVLLKQIKKGNAVKLHLIYISPPSNT